MWDIQVAYLQHPLAWSTFGSHLPLFAGEQVWMWHVCAVKRAEQSCVNYPAVLVVITEDSWKTSVACL